MAFLFTFTHNLSLCKHLIGTDKVDHHFPICCGFSLAMQTRLNSFFGCRHQKNMTLNDSTCAVCLKNVDKYVAVVVVVGRLPSNKHTRYR